MLTEPKAYIFKAFCDNSKPCYVEINFHNFHLISETLYEVSWRGPINSVAFLLMFFSLCFVSLEAEFGHRRHRARGPAAHRAHSSACIGAQVSSSIYSAIHYCPCHFFIMFPSMHINFYVASQMNNEPYLIATRLAGVKLAVLFQASTFSK